MCNACPNHWLTLLRSRAEVSEACRPRLPSSGDGVASTCLLKGCRRSGSEVDVLRALEAQTAAKPASELYSAQQRSVKPIGMVCLKIQHPKTDG